MVWRAGTHPTFVHIHGKETACFKRLYRSWRSFGKCGKRLSGIHNFTPLVLDTRVGQRSRKCFWSPLSLSRAMKRFTSTPGQMSGLGLRLEEVPAG
jgi:hypothetical protein